MSRGFFPKLLFPDLYLPLLLSVTFTWLGFFFCYFLFLPCFQRTAYLCAPEGWDSQRSQAFYNEPKPAC